MRFFIRCLVHAILGPISVVAFGIPITVVWAFRNDVSWIGVWKEFLGV